MRDIFRARPWLGRVSVLGTVAVLLAAGGGAYAATSSSGKQANGRATGATRSAFQTSARVFVAGAAVVNSNGTLARGAGVVSVSSVSTGQYQVIFNRKVNRCAFEATLGNPHAGTPPFGQIGVAVRFHNKHAVFVQTEDSAGTFTPLNFHLIVVC
jgi:hypothetical protein